MIFRTLRLHDVRPLPQLSRLRLLRPVRTTRLAHAVTGRRSPFPYSTEMPRSGQSLGFPLPGSTFPERTPNGAACVGLSPCDANDATGERHAAAECGVQVQMLQCLLTRHGVCCMFLDMPRRNVLPYYDVMSFRGCIARPILH